MNEETLLLLIKVFEAIEKLDDYIEGLTGANGLGGGPFDDLFHISRAILINTTFYDPNNEDESFDKCMEILRDEEMSDEEKCALLLGK